jgi:hypothetical protein
VNSRRLFNVLAAISLAIFLFIFVATDFSVMAWRISGGHDHYWIASESGQFFDFGTYNPPFHFQIDIRWFAVITPILPLLWMHRRVKARRILMAAKLQKQDAISQ